MRPAKPSEEASQIRSHERKAPGKSAGFALADLPVEAPLDALALEEPAGAGGRDGTSSRGASPQPGHAPAEELVDPEKILLAGEHPQPPIPAQDTPRRPAAAEAAPVPPATPAPPLAAAPTTGPTPASIAAPAPAAPDVAAASAAPEDAPPAAASVAPPQPQRAPELMDRDFIARNQVVERYLSGRLPIKGATDFERFCRENPELLDELGIPERVNAALRLLEASGKPEPWAEPRKAFWQKLEIVLGLLGATLLLAIALAIVASGSSQKTRRIAALRQQATLRPLDPATSTRDIRLLPSRDGASDSPAIIIGGGSEAQLADFRIDESRSPYRLFRITIDRINQGRVGIIDHLAKDSDGNLRIALNSTALGPGDYQLTIEGLNWQGMPQPDSWVTIGVRPTQ
ncbi:MAG: hypothetical protein KGL45_02450 [Gammaproteobacteria bacterium]|nr:hypothetical protein [Gammaproteobacteria bacterium]